MHMVAGRNGVALCAVTVVVVAAGILATTRDPVIGSGPLMTASSYLEWLRRDVAYIITDEEREAFLGYQSPPSPSTSAPQLRHHLALHQFARLIQVIEHDHVGINAQGIIRSRQQVIRVHRLVLRRTRDRKSVG